MSENLEAVNLREAVAYIRFKSEKTAIDEKVFWAIHKLILRAIRPEGSGKYKNDPIISREMNLFFNWYESNRNSLHPILLAEESHLKIMAICPFENGTVPIPNLLMNWILLQNNYVLLPSVEIRMI